MQNPERYGNDWHDVYDEYVGHTRRDTGAAVEFIAQLPSAATVLELGLGTGRLAIPIAKRGIKVEGIEASQAMIDMFERSDGSEGITVHKLDYSNFSLPAKYGVVLGAFNALSMLPTREDQMECLSCAAKALEVDGVIVVENDLPDLSNFVDNLRMHVIQSELDKLEIQLVTHNRSAQQFVAHHLSFTDSGVARRPVRMRYLGTSEIDLMAQAAGLRLAHRFADWNRSPFTSAARNHVSVYQHTAQS